MAENAPLLAAAPAGRVLTTRWGYNKPAARFDPRGSASSCLKDALVLPEGFAHSSLKIWIKLKVERKEVVRGLSGLLTMMYGVNKRPRVSPR